jgi:hypothetical protein
MKIGIVGSEAIKFNELTKIDAQEMINRLIMMPNVTEVVSGGCHLGGIDIWAAELGRKLHLKVTEFIPETLSWEGYKKRNLQIASHSDIIYCITVDKLPDSYTGMKFKLCYHCKTDKHVKSGGCWTVKQAIKMGKPGSVIVIPQR